MHSPLCQHTCRNIGRVTTIVGTALLLFLAAAPDAFANPTPTANQTSTTPPLPEVGKPVKSVNEGVTTASTAEPLVFAERQRVPDWDGVWRDTSILFGSQAVAVGILYVMPESVSNWNDDKKKNAINNYVKNFSDPAIDKDPFYINYVLHPYWGAAYYTRARERGLDKFSSFVFSAGISAMYEFGVECFFEKPSIQDLIVTPVAGSLLGAVIFEPLRDSIKRKQDLQWYDHAALVVTDPIGVLSSGIEKMFGIKSTVIVDYSIPHASKNSTVSAPTPTNSHFKVIFQFPLE